MYKLIQIQLGQETRRTLIRLTDNTCVPFALDNTDYANFKTAILEDKAQLQDADGNTMTAEQAKDFVKELP
jgi:hypothetical protein